MSVTARSIIWMTGGIILGTIANFFAHFHMPIGVGITVIVAIIFGERIEKNRWMTLLREAGYKI